MHPSAKIIAKNFYDVYCKDRNLKILDVGSLDVNGSLRDIFPSNCEYTGIDFAAGKNVDLVLEDPYCFPFSNEEFDVVLCSSVFEHSVFFWKLYIELLRIAKPHGLIYINAPSNGYIHRYPVDCWRFYPDSGIALEQWGRENDYYPKLIESFTAGNESEDIRVDSWNDFVAIFIKDEGHSPSITNRIHSRIRNAKNIFSDGNYIKASYSEYPEDFHKIIELQGKIEELNNNKKYYIEHIDYLEINLNKMHNKLNKIQLHARNLELQIKNLYNSSSWRLTAPLRYIKNRLSK